MNQLQAQAIPDISAGVKHWGMQLLLALSYFLLGLLMHSYIVSEGLVSVYWPGSGLAIAAMLLGGKRYLWGVLLGSLALNAWTTTSPLLILGLTLTNVIEAFVGSLLLSFSPRASSLLESLSDYFRFMGRGAVVCLCGALVGSLSLLTVGFVGPEDFVSSVLSWWMGDILGLALITPFLIAWSQKISLKAEPRSRLETFALFSLTLVAGQIVFLDLFKDVFNNYLDNHLMFLFMAFVAIRFSPRVVTLALLLTSIQALIGAYHHLGYFAKEIESANLGNFWVYMMIQTIDTMAISINIFSRAQLASVLKKNQDYTTAVLNSMPNEIIVLDHAGLIVSANQSWLHGSDKTNAEHLDDYLNAEIGQNYLAVLARGQGISPDDLDNAHGGIRGVLDGRIPYFNMEYAFQSPIEMRWFAMSVAPFKYDWVGAVITHTDITERKQLEDQVHQIAFRDPLTQLYNRRALNDHLSQAMAASKRSACCCALMFLDVDNFKPLNDEHGHGFGDLLLIELANRLKSCVREVDTVARFGGDEFVVLLSELHLNREASAALARSVAEKIQASLATPYLLAFDNPTDSSAVPISYQCSVSIGVVVFLGHEHNQNNILKLADVAMYQAKVAGRNLIRFYQS